MPFTVPRWDDCSYGVQSRQRRESNERQGIMGSKAWLKRERKMEKGTGGSGQIKVAGSSSTFLSLLSFTFFSSTSSFVFTHRTLMCLEPTPLFTLIALLPFSVQENNERTLTLSYFRLFTPSNLLYQFHSRTYHANKNLSSNKHLLLLSTLSFSSFLLSAWQLIRYSVRSRTP